MFKQRIITPWRANSSIYGPLFDQLRELSSRKLASGTQKNPRENAFSRLLDTRYLNKGSARMKKTCNGKDTDPAIAPSAT